MLAVTMLAACGGSGSETAGDAEAAWPAWAPLPEADAIGWYHSDSGGAETWGGALAGGDLGDNVVDESGAEDWERVSSGTGIIVDGTAFAQGTTQVYVYESGPGCE